MKVAPAELTPAETLAAAEAWYARQLEALALCHGNRWPEFEEWLSGYVREQLRQRLIERGWKPKR